ncbi:hypothetical protein, partial [Desulfobulbus propionicus]
VSLYLLENMVFFKERERHPLQCQEKNASMLIFLPIFFASNFLTGHCWTGPLFFPACHGS